MVPVSPRGRQRRPAADFPNTPHAGVRCRLRASNTGTRAMHGRRVGIADGVDGAHVGRRSRRSAFGRRHYEPFGLYIRNDGTTGVGGHRRRRAHRRQPHGDLQVHGARRGRLCHRGLLAPQGRRRCCFSSMHRTPQRDTVCSGWRTCSEGAEWRHRHQPTKSSPRACPSCSSCTTDRARIIPRASCPFPARSAGRPRACCTAAPARCG